MNISTRVGAAPGPCNGRKSHKHRRLLTRFTEERRCSDVAVVTVAGEGTVSASTASMNSSLRDLGGDELVDMKNDTIVSTCSRMPSETHPFMIKVGYLLAEDEVLKESRATISSPEALLIAYGTTNVGRQEAIRIINFILGEKVARGSRSAISSAGDNAPCVRALGLNQTKNPSKNKQNRTTSHVPKKNCRHQY
jgi:hypothetical protein